MAEKFLRSGMRIWRALPPIRYADSWISSVREISCAPDDQLMKDVSNDWATGGKLSAGI